MGDDDPTTLPSDGDASSEAPVASRAESVAPAVALPAGAEVGSKVEAPGPPRPFRFSASTLRTGSVSGELWAVSFEQAREELQRIGWAVESLEPIETSGDADASTDGTSRDRSWSVGRGKLRGDDFAAFNEQLAGLTKLGLPLERGLQLIARDARSPAVRKAVSQLVEQVNAGASVEDAIEASKDRFPPLYARVVRAGIAGGDLTGILSSLSRQITLANELRTSVFRAAVYPVILLFAACVFLALITGVLLPQFEPLVTSMLHADPEDLYFQWNQIEAPTDLPLLMRAILWLQHLWPVFALLAVVIPIAAVLLLVLTRIGEARSSLLALGTRLPLIGRMLRDGLIARWADASSVLARGSMPLDDVMRGGGELTGSPAVRRDANALADAASAGRPLADVKTKLIPPLAVAAVVQAVSGTQLQQNLQTIADTYRRRALDRARWIPRVLTPLAIIFVAIVVMLGMYVIIMPTVTMLNRITWGSF